MHYTSILDFWFREIDRKHWFQKSNQFDALLTEKFADILESASLGELVHWRENIHGRLAEIIVLDQFSRNIFRSNPRAFAQDTMALVLSQEALKQVDFENLNADERQFLLMPFMHSESKKIHEQAVELFEKYTNQHVLEYEIQHKNIIDRFGRYPHRNEILGRASTPEEIAFLQTPNSSF